MSQVRIDEILAKIFPIRRNGAFFPP